MKLQDIRIANKVLLVILLLAVVTIFVGGMGVKSLLASAAGTRLVEESDNQAVLSSQATIRAVRMNRSEFRIAANPTIDELAAQKAAIDQLGGELTKELAELRRSISDPEQLRLLGDVESAHKGYLGEMVHTLAAAGRIAGPSVTAEQQQELFHLAAGSRTAGDKLHAALDALTGYSHQRAIRLAEELQHTASRTVQLMLAVGAVGVFGGGLVGYLLTRTSIANPLRRSVESVRELANGNTRQAIYGSGRGDEIGDIAQALSVFRDNKIAADRMAGEQEAERQAKEQRATVLDGLTRSFEAKIGQLVGGLSSAALEMETTAGSMSATAEQTNQQSMVVASAAQEASANVQTVAAAAEELSSSIAEIGRQVAKSTRIAEKAVIDAESTNVAVQGLATASQKIGEVVNLISSIAGQTNLLALNATIEAARAGEAGKGFAVVASEVKALATQTARATEEISSQIAQIQGSTMLAVEAIQGIGNTIGEISEIAGAIAAAVEEQGAATQEIARNVQQAAQGTQDVTSNIAGVKEAATTTGVAASQVLGAAGGLSRQSEVLSAEVNRFLGDVQAA